MSVFSLSYEQRQFIVNKKIKLGSIQMLPRYGFNVYSDSQGSNKHRFDTNPFTKSLDHVLVKVVEFDNGYAKLSIVDSRRPVPEFWVSVSELETREVLSSLILGLVCYIPFVLYNCVKALIAKPAQQ